MITDLENFTKTKRERIEGVGTLLMKKFFLHFPSARCEVVARSTAILFYWKIGFQSDPNDAGYEDESFDHARYSRLYLPEIFQKQWQYLLSFQDLLSNLFQSCKRPAQTVQRYLLEEK